MSKDNVSTADIVYLTDADADQECGVYGINDLEELADTAEPGEIIECCTYVEGPRRWLVRDADGITALYDTREAAEKAAESHVRSEHWDDGNISDATEA